MRKLTENEANTLNKLQSLLHLVRGYSKSDDRMVWEAEITAHLEHAIEIIRDIQKGD